MSESANGEGARALDRALDLFAAISGADGHKTLVTIAAEQGLPISTAHRFVDRLLSHGLIARISRGRYIRSFGLSRGAGADHSQRTLARLARPALRALATEIGANVHLGVLDGDMVTYIVKESRRTPLFTREGMQLEAYCSAIGKVLLANMPTAALDTFLATGPFVALTSSTIIDARELREHLVSVRANGFAIDDREVHEELVCAAVPVAAPGGFVIAALSLSHMPAIPLTDKLVVRLKHCATVIEEQLTSPRAG
jgi:IclR family acetate operon transcriptional repressor